MLAQELPLHVPLPPARPAPHLRQRRTAPPPERPPGSPPPPPPAASASAAPDDDDILPLAADGTTPRVAGPFAGDYEGATWNAQGYFMAKALGHAAKRRQAQRLLARRDFLLVTEAHATIGGRLAYTNLPGTVSWWSGDTAARAGVGIIATKAFVNRFRLQLPDWQEVDPGRLAVLHLRGDEGALDLAVCYMPTGDPRPLAPEAGRTCPSTPRPPGPPPATLRTQREAICRRIPPLLHPDRALMVLAGDFNFVMIEADRWNKQAGLHSGASDAAEAAHWRRVLPATLLYELHQSEPTHEGPFSLARLDRVFTNQTVADQLDKRVFSAALAWTGGSQHRPLAFGRQSTAHKAPLDKPITEEVVRDERWPLRVAIEFRSLNSEDMMQPNPLIPLRRWKTAMRTVSASLAAERASPLATAVDVAPLSITMTALRRLEKQGEADLPALLVHYPLLRQILPQDLLQRAPGECLKRLRAHAVELARADATKALQELHDDAPKLEPGPLKQRRSQVLLLPKKVAPGRSAALTAVEDSEGTIRTDGPGMAAALRHHWRDSFAARRLNGHTRQAWLREDASRPDGLHAAVRPLLADQGAWRLRRSDVQRAIALTTFSAPGPDGIPYLAWRRLGPLAASILFDAAEELSQEQGTAAMLEAFPADEEGNTPFNAAVAVFIPKKVAHMANGVGYHKPGEVRPLSIVNTDNRLMANAMRLRIEPLLAQAISPMQRGFLPGRSMLHNVVEVDAGMRAASLRTDTAGAVFFDFAAAFPSLAHEYMLDVLRSLQVPPEVIRFVANLYTGNGCKIAAAGALYDGFCVRAGIRQGCPLSPLLFALCGDLLLRRLHSSLPEDLLRGYADDTALVADDVLKSTAAFVPLFTEFADLSGLALNLAKTVFIPLNDVSLENFRGQLARLHPGWGAAGVRHWAEYLGFVLGPEGGAKTWSKAIAKVELRSQLWAALGLGLHLTCVAYNVYVASVMGFLLQLELLPPQWAATEARVLRRLVPGPMSWIRPEDLHALHRHHGMPQEFANLPVVSLAARFRTAHREAAAAGGLQVHRAVRRLDAAFAHSEYIARGGRWRAWFMNSHYHNLKAAVTHMQGSGITIESVEAELGAEAPRPHTRHQSKRVAHGVQKAARTAIVRTEPDSSELRLRSKLQRWPLPLYPRLRASRAAAVTRRLRKLVPPRVLSAVLRTWFNGWCTQRRFQAKGSCLFGCKFGEDALEHYIRCTKLHSHAKTRMRLPMHLAVEDRGLSFMLLDSPSLLPDPQLTLRALLLTAAYRLHCNLRLRQAFTDDEVLRRALDQACKESALGHPGAIATLDGIWTAAGGR